MLLFLGSFLLWTDSLNSARDNVRMGNKLFSNFGIYFNETITRCMSLLWNLKKTKPAICNNQILLIECSPTYVIAQLWCLNSSI